VLVADCTRALFYALYEDNVLYHMIEVLIPSTPIVQQDSVSSSMHVCR
jgi:hypothetical protein